MTEERRKTIEDIVDYSTIEIDEAQLEQQLETALAEKLAYFVAGSATVVSFVSLITCLVALL